MNDTNFTALVSSHVREYLRLFPGEAARLAGITAQLARPEPIRSRKTLPGHVTAGALILDPARERMLLIFNRKLDGWMQPGGHFDPNETPHEAVLREAREETGLQGLALDPWHAARPWPIDFDSHQIPPSEAKGEPAHWHHDMRFVILADGELEVRPDAAEVAQWRWHPVRDLAAGTGPKTDLRRIALKMIDLCIAR